MTKTLAQYVDSKFADVVRGPDAMHDYQRKAVEFMLANPFSALFVDLGLGKSVISLTMILQQILDGGIDQWLVIAPKRVAAETWPTEIALWSHTAPLTFAHIREDAVVGSVNEAGRLERELIKREITEKCMWDATPLSDIKAQIAVALKGKCASERIDKARLIASRKAVRQHFKDNPACIHIISRDHVEFLIDAWGKDFPYKGVIVDESDSLKDHTTKRFKALRRVRPLIQRLHELTATPCAETYLHLFAQIYLLDEGERFTKSITFFRSQYFTYNQYTMQYTLRKGAENEIAEKMSDICLTLKAEDYLQLEKPVKVLDKILLTPAQLDLYDTMERDYIVQLPGGVEVEAETAAALSQKLLQMASGVLYQTVFDDVGGGEFKKRRIVHEIHDHKIEKLQTIVEESHGEPILVAYWHESSLARLKKAFPKAVPMDKEGKCIKLWNAGKIPMLLIHPQSGGHGLNLQHGGRRLVFFDIPWSLGLYKQLIGRLARQGQKLVVFVHHLIAAGTIDEDVFEALAVKDDAQELLFRLLKRIRRRMSESRHADQL